MDFAEQNPRAGTLARPYDYFIDTLGFSLEGEAQSVEEPRFKENRRGGPPCPPAEKRSFSDFPKENNPGFALRRWILLCKIGGRARWPAPSGLFFTRSGRFLREASFFCAGRDLSPNASGGLTPLSPPSELPEIPVATREQSGLLCFHSR